MRRRSGNVLIPAFDIRFATGDGDDVPVVQSKKVAQKISAHDSRRAGNQRLLAVRHGRKRILGADGFSQFSPRDLSLMLDLQGEVFRIYTALGETPRDKPEARLSRAGKHIAQLVAIP